MPSLIVNNTCDLCRKKYHYHYLDLAVSKTHTSVRSCFVIFSNFNLSLIWERGVDIRIRVAKHLKYSHVQSSAFHVKKLYEARDRQEVFLRPQKKVSVKIRDSAGGPVVKNLPSNAGDVGSIPGQGLKTPHGKGQLGPQPQLLILSPHTLEPLTHN